MPSTPGEGLADRGGQGLPLNREQHVLKTGLLRKDAAFLEGPHDTEAVQAVRRVKKDCQVAALTRSELGSVVVSGEDVHEVPAEPVKEVVDTTGAGDLYAAGFLFAS